MSFEQPPASKKQRQLPVMNTPIPTTSPPIPPTSSHIPPTSPLMSPPIPPTSRPIPDDSALGTDQEQFLTTGGPLLGGTNILPVMDTDDSAVGSDESIILYEGFDDEEEHHYRRYLHNPRDKMFVVTEGFKKLRHAVTSGKESILIGGPKGVGKSWALAAIATLCRKEGKQCFLWSPGIDMSPWFTSYVRKVFGEECSKFGNMKECMYKIFEAKCKALLLVELGSINNYTSEEKKELPLLLPLLSIYQCIISLSSGDSNFTYASGDFGRTLLGITRSSTEDIEFVPFTNDEFSILRKVYSNEYPLAVETYKYLTNFNPLLLASIKQCDEEKAKCVLKGLVQKLCSDITKSLKNPDYEWVEKSLPESINMLIHAANGMKIAACRIDEYYGTWVYAEHITYVCEKFKDEFMLAINFPTCFENLLQVLYKYRAQENIKIHCGIIDGFYFEREICTTIKQLDVLYSQKDEAVALQPDLQTIVFNFKCHVSNQASNSPVKSLPEGVFFFLRPFHPVIDAVAYVRVGETPWLVLIQVSFSDYHEHSSKVNDLKNKITGCEENKKTKKLNWLDYYRQRVPPEGQEGLKCVYVYVSPKEFIESDPSTNLSPYNLRRKEGYMKGIFFGLILKNSSSAQFISVAKERVTRN